MNVSALKLNASIDDTSQAGDAIAANASSLWDAGASIRLRNVALQFHWLALPNVTLAQAAWLLLDKDPAMPPTRHSSSTACPHYHHAELLNRLECEVATGRLRPLKNGHPSMTPRFEMVKILTVATEIGINAEVATEILTMSHQLPRRSLTETARSRRNDRMHWQVEFVRSLPKAVVSSKKTCTPEGKVELWNAATSTPISPTASLIVAR
jgi:hypothetical protein